MALKKQIKETKAAEVKAAAETKEEVKTAEDKVSEKVEEVKENLLKLDVAKVELRMSNNEDKPLVTDNGNFIIHAWFNKIEADLEWEQKFENPIEIVDIIGAFIENDDAYKISMWISMDEGCFIHVSDDNADEIIRYLYERFPY